MNIKKLLAMGSLAVLLSANLSGCMTVLTVDNMKDKTYYENTSKQCATENLAGFVINQDGKLIMLSQNYVYVFNDNDNTKKLKHILTTPEFLNLKQMSWTTVDRNGATQSIDKYDHNNSFSFNAKFDFMYKSEREFIFLSELGLHNINTKLTSWDKKMYNGYGEIKSHTHFIHLGGTMYQHNNTTQELLKKSKHLSKPYTFSIICHNSEQVTKKASAIRKAGSLLILPFAVVGDVLTFPFSMTGARLATNGWH